MVLLSVFNSHVVGLVFQVAGFKNWPAKWKPSPDLKCVEVEETLALLHQGLASLKIAEWNMSSQMNHLVGGFHFKGSHTFIKTPEHCEDL